MMGLRRTFLWKVGLAGLLALLWWGCAMDDSHPSGSSDSANPSHSSTDSLLVLCLSTGTEGAARNRKASNKSSSGAASSECVEELRSFRGPFARSVQPLVRTSLSQAAGLQKNHPVLVVGPPGAIAGMPVRDSAFSVGLADSSFTVRGRKGSSPANVLLAHRSSPWSSEHSAYLVVARQQETAVQYAVRGLPFSVPRGGYRVLRNERLVARRGPLNVAHPFVENAQGTPASFQQHRSLRGGGPTVETEHLRVYAVDESAFSKERVHSIARRQERVRGRVRALLGSDILAARKIDYYLFGDAQSLGTLGIEMPPETVLAYPAPHFTRWSARRRYVDVVPGRAARLTYPRDAVIWARDAQGHPATALLEVGVAVVSETDPSGSLSYRRRAARLHRAGLVPELDTLLSEHWRRHASPLLVEPLAGAVVDFLLDRWGRKAFRHRYASWTLRKADSASVRQAWRRYLDTLDSIPARPGEAFPEASSSPGQQPFRNGITMAYASGPVKSPEGYASAAADSSQVRARQLGANSIAIVPYTEVPSADTAVSLLPRRHNFDGEVAIVGGESDASIVHAIRDAHRRNLAVMLKPQFGVHVEWPGAVQMDSEIEWNRFFRAYRRWIVHYALLAERYDVEQFAIGTELVHAVRERPDWWRQTIENIRHVYDGSLTYAAHWENARKISFWDALDVVGINAYAPLSKHHAPSDSALVAGAERFVRRWSALHRRTGRPVVLTEAGASNRAAPWTAPYEKREDQPVRPQEQARTYAALIEAIEDEEWIRGVYWWRLPVAPSDTGPFTIPGTPAADVLSGWYRGNS